MKKKKEKYTHPLENPNWKKEGFRSPIHTTDILRLEFRDEKLDNMLHESSRKRIVITDYVVKKYETEV